MVTLTANGHRVLRDAANVLANIPQNIPAANHKASTPETSFVFERLSRRPRFK
jgi:hypothetical protein